jgi:hypothetical protein
VPAPFPWLCGRRPPTWALFMTFPPATLVASTHVGAVQRSSRACVCHRLVCPLSHEASFFCFFFLSTIYNAGLARSPQACSTNSTYSTTTLRIAHYYIPGPRSLLLAGDHRHKACSLFQDNVALLSSECGREPTGRRNRHVYPRIALGKVPRPEPTTEGGAVAGRR